MRISEIGLGGISGAPGKSTQEPIKGKFAEESLLSPAFGLMSPAPRASVGGRYTFNDLLNKGRVPINLQVDKGTEFYNKNVKSLLKEY